MTETTKQLFERMSPWVEALGYEIVHLEVHTQRHKTLRLYIDHLGATDESPAIGVEDCAKVSRGIDEQLDLLPEVEQLFHGQYELEVSSPGIDRPLWRANDYNRFAGREARIHTYRALNAEEIGDAEYFAKNPRQKNFLGTLKGLQGDRVRLLIPTAPNQPEITIPVALISKANLEPEIDFERSTESTNTASNDPVVIDGAGLQLDTLNKRSRA